MGTGSELALSVSPFTYRGLDGATVYDRAGGVTYRAIAGGRTATGRPSLTYLAVEVADGLLLEDVRQLAWQHLAVIAAEVAAEAVADRGRDAERNAKIRERMAAGTQKGGTIGVASVRLPEDRDRPADASHPVLSPQWTARIFHECRASNSPTIQTIAALADVSPSTARRAIQRAVEAGLLEPQRRGRPAHTPKGTPDA